MDKLVQMMNRDFSSLHEYLMGNLPVVVFFLLKVVFSILVFLVGRKLILWVVKLIHKSMEKAGIELVFIQFLCSMIKLLLNVLLVVNIAYRFGVTETSVAALIGTAGVTLGLALQGGLSNVAGGLMFMLFQPFKVEDYIVCEQQGNCEGVVKKINICYTTLCTVDNKQIVIPNGQLANKTVTNVTQDGRRRLRLQFQISYDADLKEAMKVIEDVMRSEERVYSEDDMMIFVEEMGSSAVAVGVIAWVQVSDYWKTRWSINQKIKEVFDRKKIQIPYNQLDVYVKNKNME